eukprot:TRINITY_DN10205_c0_g1_i4.p1 TRINITY_DN10205_c0_g1~~TRINITY_DN10205_c0_g1_i4.p1  ORF type:complete len:178 (-),score=52.63 TRINITY_DN10205_c0_g1_i4:146-679(-)
MCIRDSGYSVLPGNKLDAEKPALANLVWLFYMSKGLDFFDTVQIVLGKKWRQLSFLHVYHHSSIWLVYWVNLRVNYDGDIYLTIVLNGFIHSVMYLYYFVSLHTSNIWWKPFVTRMQLVQFTCMLAQASYIMETGSTESPPRMTKIYWGYIVTMMVLFMNFYMKNYKKKDVSKPKIQ